MRKLVYYVACSVDLFIARDDGSYDFLLQEGEQFADLIAAFPETFPAPARKHFAIQSENQHFDTVLMGRETYAVGVKVGLTNPYPQLQQLVFSRTMDESPAPQVELVRGDAVARVEQLKRQAGRDIWLCGGSTLAATLFEQIDELILKVSPVLLGAGKGLFAGAARTTSLELVSSKSYRNGFLLLHYRMAHRPGSSPTARPG